MKCDYCGKDADYVNHCEGHIDAPRKINVCNSCHGKLHSRPERWVPDLPEKGTHFPLGFWVRTDDGDRELFECVGNPWGEKDCPRIVYSLFKIPGRTHVKGCMGREPCDWNE